MNEMIIPRVPAPVLMSKFSDTTKALMDVMSKQATSETASALRWVSRFITVSLLIVNLCTHTCTSHCYFCIYRSCHALPLC